MQVLNGLAKAIIVVMMVPLVITIVIVNFILLGPFILLGGVFVWLNGEEATK